MPPDRVPRGAVRPETELLLLCARTRIGADAARRIAELLGRELNWIFVVRDALGHQVLPQVYVNLKALGGDAVPAAILGQLERYFEAHVRRNARLTEELLKLLALLEVHSIPALSVKGPTLAVAAYGDVSLRDFCDLDFLVRAEDARRATDVLLDEGYRLATVVEADGSPSNFWEPEYHLYKDDGPDVEFHWRLTSRRLRAALDYESLGGRRQLVVLDGVPVPTLPAEDTLLMLCVHGGKHYWGLLKWVCDVAALVGAAPEMDWRRVEASARRSGCWRAVGLGLHLAADLLDAPLPADVLRSVRRNRRVSWLADRVRARLLGEERAAVDDPESYPYSQFEFSERLSDWVWAGLRFAGRIVTVTRNDRGFVTLRGPLSAAYYPLRILRGLALYGVVLPAQYLRRKIRGGRAGTMPRRG